MWWLKRLRGFPKLSLDFDIIASSNTNNKWILYLNPLPPFDILSLYLTYMYRVDICGLRGRCVVKEGLPIVFYCDAKCTPLLVQPDIAS